MPVPDDLAPLVQNLLTRSTGDPVTIVQVEPVYGATVFRCMLDRPTGDLEASVIVKLGRAPGEFRSDAAMMRNEIAALHFLTAHDLSFGPRLIAADPDALVAVMEDLGDGPSLEDVLFDDDVRAAIDGLVAFGTALGEMHAATAGRADAFFASMGRFDIGTALPEPVSPFGGTIRSRWERLRQSVEDPLTLPCSGEVVHDVEAMLRTLAPVGPYLTMTNGDPCPANTRIVDGSLRFLDFEHATFQHALLDLTALHLPFPACPCWSLLPERAAAPAIHAWRTAFARHHPGVIDDDEFAAGAAAACLTWAILRLVRWTRLDIADEPHPVGFTKRAQCIATIDAAVRVAERSGTLPALTDWFAGFSSALGDRWTDSPLTTTVFPAFAADCPELPVGSLPPVPDGTGEIRYRR